jgi:FkbM family methyltransferase
MLLVLSAVYRRELRVSGLWLIGRSPVCSLREAITSLDYEKIQVRVKDDIVAHSRLLQEDPAGFLLWDTPQGRYWIPSSSKWAIHWDLAEQARRIYGVGPRAVRSGDVVLDCGANVGVYTRVALDAGARLVVAIEPAPENLICLRRTFAAEIAAGRVLLVPKGVWDKEDILSLKVDRANSAADSFVLDTTGQHDFIKVPLTTIDKLAEELHLDRVDFIKMDIEGAEQQALTGARSILARFHPRLAISAYHKPEDPKRIPVIVHDAWSGYGMECGYCLTDGRRVIPSVLFFR